MFDQHRRTSLLFIALLACQPNGAEPDDKAPGGTELPLGKADFGHAIQARGTIAFEETKSHVRLETGEYHGYTFAARAGACIEVTMDAEVAKEPDTYLFVLGSGQEVLAEDDDSGPGQNSEIEELVLDEAGMYTIVATAYQGEGNGHYAVTLSCCNGRCEPEPEVCAGGEDEDVDGDVDCDDADCADSPSCSGGGDAEICTNGLDDDGDGLTDCWDVQSCFDDPACADRPGRLAAAATDTIGIHHAGEHPTTQWGETEWLPVYAWRSDASTPLVVPNLSGASSVTIESSHACAIVGEGQVYCWGGAGASHYAIGLGGIWDDWNRIYRTPGPASPTHIHAGMVQRHIINETEDFNEPNTYVAMGALSRIRQIDAGRMHTCAVHESGSVLCWGENQYGQIGDIASHYGAIHRSTYRTGHALEVPGVGQVVQVSAGFRHTCARHVDGTVSCWGDNEFGQLGDGTRSNRRSRPAKVLGLTNVRHVSAGLRQTCAVHGDGDVSCWGEVHQDLAPGLTRTQTRPLAVSGLLLDATQVETDGYITCAVGDGRLGCWVANGALTGQDGSPSLVPGIEDAVELGVGTGHVCVRRDSGTFMCMGSNHDGQLGDGTTTPRTSPVPVITNPI